MRFEVDVRMYETIEDEKGRALVLEAHGEGATAEQAYENAVGNIGEALSRSDSKAPEASS